LAAMARLVLIAEELGINYSHFPSFFSFIWSLLFIVLNFSCPCLPLIIITETDFDGF
jgi:hypothetical protein